MAAERHGHAPLPKQGKKEQNDNKEMKQTGLDFFGLQLSFQDANRDPRSEVWK